MLDKECVRPEKLGYDRPSDKLRAFLGRHYDLKNYIQQNNNYVVFSKYFEPAGQSNSDKPEHRKQSSFSQNPTPLTRQVTFNTNINDIPRSGL